MMLHRLFLAFIFASLTFLPLSFSHADDYGPFLPPSVAKEKQIAKEKEAQAVQDKANGVTVGEKVINNLSTLFKPAPVTKDPKTLNAPVERAPFISTTPPNLPDVPALVEEDPLPKMPKNTRVDNPANKMGLAYAAEQLNKVLDLQKQGKSVQAVVISKDLDSWLIDATETHIDLYQVLNRVPSARVQASFEKKLGLEFAKLRDRNLLALGQLYRELGQDRKAVRPLVQLIQSQSRTELGLQAYKILQDMGFTEELSLTN
ncbi:MAG: hypothetical protein LW809_00185 [Vampirovibrionales bacterium]|jgi:hypothetical protein|nr:hypothetical protein [Vampirovibrionales bacterium]